MKVRDVVVVLSRRGGASVRQRGKFDFEKRGKVPAASGEEIHRSLISKHASRESGEEVKAVSAE